MHGTGWGVGVDSHTAQEAGLRGLQGPLCACFNEHPRDVCPRKLLFLFCLWPGLRLSLGLTLGLTPLRPSSPLAVLTLPLSPSFRNLLDKDMFSKSDPRKSCSDTNNSNNNSNDMVTDGSDTLEPFLSSSEALGPFPGPSRLLLSH